MNFELFRYGNLVVLLSILVECNAEGREEGRVVVNDIDEVTGRATVREFYEFEGRAEKEVSIANALRVAADYI
jgi:hypothetical protein